ncbi:MAG: M23 family metallopeptidase [Burkholderiaceae bacterium]|uniref:M23 family metallopeptidase n=1 Tax=Herminiimonas contaminans TaxID=1111140 RepID=A0ABS0EPG1_9BURK|nr:MULTISPECIES: M23 family metallopeptidase [Oxalobacteraceae]MBF8176418.1 M23 family metallopeptidase [Herminiimonas contaminans]MBX9799989.1 M23 family metallopeptidase [Burkholderiaceae bacterium]
MQIILLHPRFTHAKSVTLTRRHLLALFVSFVVAVILGASFLSYLVFSNASSMPSPVRELVSGGSSGEEANKDKFLKENLALMARRLGEMQAQLMRLDALGERVQGLAGVKPTEFNFREMPGRGGIEPMDGTSSRDLTMSEFKALLDAMAHDVERRADYMNVVESTLMSDKIKSKLLPTIQPVNVSYNASTFGRRLDPFSGRSAMHEGIDFAAPIGTPIVAAAGGVVTVAEFHPQYGNMMEIDHGNDMITRYAHTSRLLMQVGDIVRRGQHIADIGTTGRSTGPHLHFEVRVKGVAQDPHKFLLAGANQARLAAK